MIPGADALGAAYASVVARLGVSPRVGEAALRVAVREAEHLAEDIFEEPAALVYALARSPRCFPGGARSAIALFALAQARAVGLRLDMPAAELGDVVRRVALQELPYERVREMLAGYIVPFAG